MHDSWIGSYRVDFFLLRRRYTARLDFGSRGSFSSFCDSIHCPAAWKYEIINCIIHRYLFCSAGNDTAGNLNILRRSHKSADASGIHRNSDHSSVNCIQIYEAASHTSCCWIYNNQSSVCCSCYCNCRL